MKRKKIAVYDSRAADCTATAEAIREHYNRVNEAAEVVEFTVAHDFVLEFRDNYYDMVFLAMNSPLDLETARKVGGVDLKCPLFFVSDTQDYGLEGYRLMALDYLIKPVTHERILEAVSRIGSAFAEVRERRKL